MGMDCAWGWNYRVVRMQWVLKLHPLLVYSVCFIFKISFLSPVNFLQVALSGTQHDDGSAASPREVLQTSPR